MKPKQYIKGYVEWYKLKLKVTPDVLIPRPETELLVDEVLRHIRSHLMCLKLITILDIGTGSGNIAIALACNLKGCNVNIIATDISDKALKVAKQNAKLYGVLDKQSLPSGEVRIEFIQSDLLSEFNSELFTLHSALIIVTNLPYIPSSRIPTLDSSVKDFEPYIALDGGENGFELYNKLFTQIKEKGLNPDLLVGEIDYTHADLAVSIAKKHFPEMEIEVKKDLVKMPRILSIKKVT